MQNDAKLLLDYVESEIAESCNLNARVAVIFPVGKRLQI